MQLPQLQMPSTKTKISYKITKSSHIKHKKYIYKLFSHARNFRIFSVLDNHTRITMIDTPSSSSESFSPLPRIYFRQPNAIEPKLTVSSSFNEVATNANPSLHEIENDIQRIQDRISNEFGMHASNVDMQLIIFDLCKLVEQLVQYMHSYKTTTQIYSPQKFKALGNSLSMRQVQVLALAGQGLRNNDIAARLGVSIATVAHHLSKAYKTLGVKSRGKALALCREQKVI